MALEQETILPTNDLMFKHIFWNKEHPNILISFINSILKRDNPITSVELISTEHDSIVEHCDSIVKQMNDDFVGEHGIRLDLVGKTSTGEILNIEMQKRNDDDMYKRSLYYWAKLYSSQLNKGRSYKELCPVITINILGFNLFKDTKCDRNFILKDEKTNEAGPRMIEMHFVELNKRRHMDQNDELWLWAEFLQAPNSKNLINAREENESIRDAKTIYDKALADPVQKEKMRLLEKTQMDNLSSITKAHDEGLAEGEHRKALETARNFLKMGLSVEQVAIGTGLTIEEVKLL